MTIDRDETLNSDRAQERDLLAQMVEQAPSIMAFVREPSHRVVMANKAFRQLSARRSSTRQRLRYSHHRLPSQPSKN
jgi:hypothetical protein